MDDDIGAGHDLVALTEVREVRDQGLAVLAAVGRDVHVEHVVSVRDEVPDDPSTGLATASGHHDPHVGASCDGFDATRVASGGVGWNDAATVSRRVTHSAAWASQDQTPGDQWQADRSPGVPTPVPG